MKKPVIATTRDASRVDSRGVAMLTVIAKGWRGNVDYVARGKDCAFAGPRDDYRVWYGTLKATYDSVQ